VPGFYAIRLRRGIVFRAMANPPTRARRERSNRRFGAAQGEYSAKAARIEARRLIGLIRSGVDPRRPQVPGCGKLRDAWEHYKTDWLAKRNASPATPVSLPAWIGCRRAGSTAL
jgi:hypothetical protein